MSTYFEHKYEFREKLRKYVNMIANATLISRNTKSEIIYKWKDYTDHEIVVTRDEITYIDENVIISFDRGTGEDDEKILTIIFSRIYPYIFQRLFTFTSKFDNSRVNELDRDIISTIKGKYIDIL